MKPASVATLLVLSAVAVGVQNYVFFRAVPVVSVVDDDPYEDEEEAFDDDDASDGAPPEITPTALRQWLASQPGPHRSPFLTADEARVRVVEPTGPGLPSLDGTLIGSHRRVAWINGRAHGEGDWIEGHRIEKIEAEHVVLARGEERVALQRSVPAPVAGEVDIVSE